MCSVSAFLASSLDTWMESDLAIQGAASKDEVTAVELDPVLSLSDPTLLSMLRAS